MNAKAPQHESPWPHWAAVLLVCATFPLIWVGGLVTTTDSGMAVPDWPTSFGYNMFALPVSEWLATWSVFIEHTHRLLGALVGLLSIVLLVVFWLLEPRRWVRLLAVVALAAVVFQGVLGGLRVIENERLLAMMHGCVGPAFFGLCVGLAVVTSRRWRESVGAFPHAGAPRLHRLVLLTTLLAYLQLTLGAAIRHVPPTASSGQFLGLVMFHLLLAAALAGHIVVLAWRVWRLARGRRALTVPAMSLAVLLAVQLVLGAAAWVTNYGWPAFMGDYGFAQAHVVTAQGAGQVLVTTAHAAVGSLMLAFGVTLALRSLRLVQAEAAEGKPAETRVQPPMLQRMEVAV